MSNFWGEKQRKSIFLAVFACASISHASLSTERKREREREQVCFNMATLKIKKHKNVVFLHICTTDSIHTRQNETKPCTGNIGRKGSRQYVLNTGVHFNPSSIFAMRCFSTHHRLEQQKTLMTRCNFFSTTVLFE